MVAESQATSVRKLRVASRDPDPSALRRRLERVLSSANLSPSNLPPSAILCVRRLRDPLPGTLSIDRGEMRPSPRWEQAVHASLDQMVRRAARPAQGMVPADAEAVLFADRAELLACLAQDWCEGTASTRWWWQSLFRTADFEKAVFASWRDAPQYIPGTLHYLAMSGQAVQFVRALSVPDARAILERMTEVFALSKLRLAFRAAAEREPEPAAENETVQETPEVLHESPPWQRWVPEGQGDGLAVEQQCVLGIGLMLYRAPLVVRTLPFAQTVSEWRSSKQNGTDSVEGINLALRHTQGKRGASGDPTEDFPVDKQMPLPREDGLPSGPDSFAITSHVAEDNLGDRDQSAKTVSTSDIVDHLNFVKPRQGDQPSANQIDPTVAEHGAGSDVQSMLLSGEICTPRPEIEAVRMPGVSVDTAFGGVFYLMNLALYLNLYGDFSTPLQPGIALSPWDFLALVGEQLVGERIHADPVWPLLAQLAGRDEGDVPGQDFHPSAEWRLQMMEQWGYDDQSIPHQVASTPFIEWLIPFVRVRLMQALGLDQEHELAKVLCEHRANVSVTATHVDVMLSLADLPIAIRFAGLDRNPGWIPAAGRYLAFHFE